MEKFGNARWKMTEIKRFEVNHILDGYHEVVIEDDAGKYPGIYVLAADHDAALKAKDAEIAYLQECIKSYGMEYESKIDEQSRKLDEQARVIEELTEQRNDLIAGYIALREPESSPRFIAEEVNQLKKEMDAEIVAKAEPCPS